MSGSSIPAALDALVALFTNVRVPGLQVVDGPVWDASNDFLAVGWDRTGEDSVTFVNTPAGADPRRGRESYEITNLLSVWYGANDDLSVVRARLFSTYNQLADALCRGMRLDGGSVLTAWPTAGGMTPGISDSGTYVDLRFTITVQALT